MRTASWFGVIAMALIGLVLMGCKDEEEDITTVVVEVARGFEETLEDVAGIGLMEEYVADGVYGLLVADFVWESFSADLRRSTCIGAHAVALTRGFSGSVMVVTRPNWYVVAKVFDDGRVAFFDGELRLTMSELNAITPEQMQALKGSQ